MNALQGSETFMSILPFKKILAPVDFSEFSFKSLQNAADLATHFDAELYVLHVTQPVEDVYYLSPYAPAPTDMTEYLAEARHRALDNLHRMIERLHCGVETHVLLREGHPVDEIVGAARDEGVSLVVISTHGIGGWHHLMFGSVAENVIRLSATPVLVTHAAKPDEA